MSTILEEVLEEEYARSLRATKALETEIEQLPKGYLRSREVNGRIYYYLQWREGKKVRSKYVRSEEVDLLRKQIALRKSHIKALKDQEQSREMIVRALGKARVIGQNKSRP